MVGERDNRCADAEDHGGVDLAVSVRSRVRALQYGTVRWSGVERDERCEEGMRSCCEVNWGEKIRYEKIREWLRKQEGRDEVKMFKCKITSKKRNTQGN